MKGSLCRLAETSFLWRDTAMRIRERFNPRAPCGARRGGKTASCGELIFQPTRPLRGATRRVVRGCKNQMHFNPRAPCGARPAFLGVADMRHGISTHAPLAGRDPAAELVLCGGDISTHAPLAGRDNMPLRVPTGRLLFQPTRPLRGATAKVYKSLCTFLR